MIMQITPRKLHGFTIIELMVAITISALILGVLTQVYAGAKRSYRVAEALSRMQENGRYALDYLARDFRLAGYTGCLSGGSTVNNIAKAVTGWSPLNTATSPITLQGIEGYEASTVTASAITASSAVKTDAVLVQFFSPSSAKLVHPSPTNANIKINSNTLNFQANEVLVVTDCAFADILKATSVSNSGSPVTIAHAMSTNTSTTTSKEYGQNAEVMRMQSNVYYIDTKTVGGVAIPSLMRRRLGSFDNGDATQSCTNATASTTQGFCIEEIAEGVEDLQLLYGVDTNADLSADKFVAASSVAAADWPKVVSVRVNLLVRSVETNVSPEANTTYPVSQIPLLNGTPPAITAATSRAFRRVYTETIALRNRAL